MKRSDVLLAASLAVMSSSLITGGALVYESATGQLKGEPARASQLFLATLGLSHISVVPLWMAGQAIQQERDA